MAEPLTFKTASSPHYLVGLNLQGETPRIASKYGAGLMRRQIHTCVKVNVQFRAN